MACPAVRLLMGAVLVACGLAAPAAARAQMAWTACQPAGYQCAKLPVALDPSGATPGTVTLSVTRRPARTPDGSALLTLAGGPGQAAVPLAQDFAAALAPGLGTRDLLVFDQRGTGGSGELHCPALDFAAGSLPDAVERCARELGPSRAFYTTAQSVADIEALRAAAGYERLTIYGVSYGTKVALAYAAAYPAHVEALVLDSVVTPQGPDALERSTLHAVPRVLRELCGGGACRGITTGVVRDAGHLAARLRRKALRGPVYAGDGHRLTATLGEAGLLGIIQAGDLNPALRAELPGSLRAALTGDAKPILRLSARAAGLDNGDAWQAIAADSDALFFTTTCEDSLTLPWTRDAARAQRVREAETAVLALPAAATAPFSASVVLQGVPRLCLGYPPAAPPPAEPAAPPAVPALVLDGKADVRTPLEDAQGVAAQIPGAQVVAVPHTGHSVLGTDESSCTRAALTAFFSGAAAGACPARENPYAPTPRPPLHLARLHPPRGVHGRAGQTVQALRLTVRDAHRQVIGEALALGTLPGGVGGLRGGDVRVTQAALHLHRYAYVPGVTVTGTVPDRGTAVLRVGGSRAAHGTVRVTQGGRVSGTLGGRRVRTSFATAARAGDRGLARELRAAITRGRLARAAR